MKAKMLPLSGKYYGTRIEIRYGLSTQVITLWDNGNFKPSIRQIERLGYTKEQYDNNELVDDGWSGKCTVKEAMGICDSHFESETTYEFARQIVKKLNSYFP